MSDNVRTKLELLENGGEYAQKAIEKAKAIEEGRTEQEPKIQVDDVETVPVEEQNIVFKPNEGPSNRVSCNR